MKKKAIQKKYQNLATEKNTMKFLDYFQDFVQQHRSKILIKTGRFCFVVFGKK